MISYRNFLNFVFNENPQATKSFWYLDRGVNLVDIESIIYCADNEKSVEFYETLVGEDCENKFNVPCIVLKIDDLSDLDRSITPALNRYDSIIVVDLERSEDGVRTKEYYKVWYIE